MFYEDDMDDALRFGDVLRGYVSTIPKIKEPILSEQIIYESYNVDINLSEFSVVVTPCCSIGWKTISLTPLLKIRGSFFDNEYLADDLTRINRKMEPQQAVPLRVWEGFPEEEKLKRLKEGFGYAFLELFIYKENDLLPEYTVHRRQGNIDTKYYMIDFRNTYKLNCDLINTPKDAPINSKYLQLSIPARSELREKLSYYYARLPEEDIIPED
jgi:hypothetical protein